VTVNPGGHGQTPGFWKNNAIKWGAVAWKNYTPNQLLSSVFTIPASLGLPSNLTLLGALQLNGGGVNALLRQAVAALLNSSNSLVNYPITTANVISMTNAGWREVPARSMPWKPFSRWTIASKAGLTSTAIRSEDCLLGASEVARLQKPVFTNQNGSGRTSGAGAFFVGPCAE
jgi:hypothetical protein